MTQEEKKEVNAQEKTEKENEEQVEEQPRMELPPVTFENFIFGMYNNARLYMGFRDPETGNLIQELSLARHTIDTIGMIQEKTKGNLSASEGNMLENLLYELRMSYLRSVEQAKEAAKQKPEPEPESKEPEPKEEKGEETAADKDGQ